MNIKLLKTGTWLMFCLIVVECFGACKPKGGEEPEPDPTENKITRYVSLADFKQYNVFYSGREEYTESDGKKTKVNSYRIPTLVTSKENTLIAACEARLDMWNDKSPTVVAVKRSTDGGQTWSAIKFVTQRNGEAAFMDPTLVADLETGELFLFCTRWESRSAETTENNVTFLSTSKDDGVTWSTPVDVNSKVCAPNSRLAGTGPGSGFQMRMGKKYPGRLIVPSRQQNQTTNASYTHTIYSDDHGATWKVGTALSPAGEEQMAETPNDRLILNMRRGADRWTSTSFNGGESWTAAIKDPTLVSPDKGCQGSLLGLDSLVLFTCPAGGPTKTPTTDNRYDLTLWRSISGGNTWPQKYIVDRNASGYSCLTTLKDGRIVVLYETADSDGTGFYNQGGAREEGWMILKVMVIPADIRQKSCWIKP